MENVVTDPIEDKKKKLHEFMVGKKVYTKSYNEFEQQFSTPEKINKLHQFLKGRELYTKGEKDFRTQFFSESNFSSDLNPKLEQRLKKISPLQEPLVESDKIQAPKRIPTEDDKLYNKLTEDESVQFSQDLKKKEVSGEDVTPPSADGSIPDSPNIPSLKDLLEVDIQGEEDLQSIADYSEEEEILSSQINNAASIEDLEGMDISNNPRLEQQLRDKFNELNPLQEPLVESDIQSPQRRLTEDEIDANTQKSFEENIANRDRLEAEQAAKDEVDTGQSRLASGMNQFAQSAYVGSAQLLKGGAVMADWLENNTGINNQMFGGEQKVEEMALWKAGTAIQKFAKEHLPTNPAYQGDFWTSTIPQGAASIYTIAMGGLPKAILKKGTTKALKQSALQVAEKNAYVEATKQVAKKVASGEMVMGGMMMGVPEYENAKKAGLSDNEAFEVFTKNYMVGLTDAVSVGMMFSRLNKLTKGGVVNVLNTGFKNGVTEMTQEVVQNYMTNTIAKNSYDEFRNLYEGMMEEGAVGFVLGAILGSAGAVIKKGSDPKLEKYIKDQEALLKENGFPVATTTKKDITTPVSSKEVSAPKTKLPIKKETQEEPVSEEKTTKKAEKNESDKETEEISQKKKDNQEELRESGAQEDVSVKDVEKESIDLQQKDKESEDKQSVKADKPIWNNDAVLTGEIKKTKQAANPNYTDADYKAESNKLAKKEAQRMLNENEIVEVEKAALDTSNNMKGNIRDNLLIEIAKHHKKEGNRTKEQEFFNKYKERGREAGQQLSSRKETTTDPDVVTMEVVSNIIEDTNNKLNEVEDDGKQLGENITEEFTQLQKVAEKHGVSITDSDTFNTVVDKVVNKIVNQKTGRIDVSKAKIRKSKATRKSLIEELKKANKPSKAQSNIIPGLTPENITLAVKIAKTYVDEGVANIELISNKVKEEFKAVGLNINKEDLAKIKEEVVKGRLTAKDIKQQIKDLVTRSDQSKKEGKTSIYEQLTEDLGLSEIDAKKIERVVNVQMDKMMAEESKAYYERIKSRSEKKVAPKKIKQSYEKLTELLNAGKLTEEAYRDQVLNDLGYLTASSEAVNALVKMSDAIQNLPDGKVKRRAIDEFFDKADSLKNDKKTYFDFLLRASSWIYASMLSRTTTQFNAIVGALSSSSGGAISSILNNPLASAVDMFSNNSFRRGIKRSGAAAWMDAMKLGVSDFEFINAKESYTDEDGNEIKSSDGYKPKKITKLDKTINRKLAELNQKDGILTKIGYLMTHPLFVTSLTPVVMYRHLMAFDAGYKSGIKEREAYIKEYNDLIAEKDQPSRLTKAFYKELNKRLALDKSTIDEINEEVDIDMKTLIDAGYKDLGKHYRSQLVSEKIDQRRRKETVEASIRAADAALLMGTPTGGAGYAYRWLNKFSSLDKKNGNVVNTITFFLKHALFLFNRIGANVTQSFGMYYVGAAQAAWGKTHLRQEDGKAVYREYSKEEKGRLRWKTAMGVATVGGVFLSMFNWDDDDLKLKEDRVIDITAGGHGNYHENLNAEDKGFEAYSFRVKKPNGEWGPWISYKLHWFGMMFAPMGAIRDNMFYKKFEANAPKEKSRKKYYDGSSAALISESIKHIPLYMSDQSYSQGMDGLIKVIQGVKDKDKSAADPFMKIASRPLKAATSIGIYEQAFNLWKGYNDISDKDSKGVFKYVTRNNVLLEHFLEQKKYDAFGYEIHKGTLSETIFKEVSKRKSLPIWRFLDSHPNTSIPPFYAPKHIDIKKRDGVDRHVLTEEEQFNWERVAQLVLRGKVERWMNRRGGDLEITSSQTVYNTISKYRAEATAEANKKYTDTKYIKDLKKDFRISNDL